MNIVWHLVKKDLRHFRWSFVVWLTCLAYMVVVKGNAPFHPSSELTDYVRLIATITVAVVSSAMLISIVQQDHPTGGSAFWRTRPIGRGHLLIAKLGLIVAVFVGIPIIAILSGTALRDRIHFFREYAFLSLVLLSLALSLAAAASCTRNMIHAFLLWVGALLGSTALGGLLGQFMPDLSQRLSAEMTHHRVLVLLVVSVGTSLAALLNQYLTRRLSFSILILVAGAVGAALVGTLFSYYYFY